MSGATPERQSGALPKRNLGGPITAADVRALEPGQFLRAEATIEDFDRLVAELPERRSSRVTFASGILEVAIPTRKHEHIKGLLHDLVIDLAEELGLWADSFGSMTFRKRGTDAGGEPDDCFYIYKSEAAPPEASGNLDTDPSPDLVIEIDLSSSSAMKNELYANYGVREIWRYDDETGRVSILRLAGRGYRESPRSLLLRGVTREDINTAVAEAPPNRKAVRACVERVRERKANLVRVVATETFINSIGMEFVLVPAGEFMMGGDKDDSEKPVHRVTITAPFYLGKFQVTQGEWEAVMGDNPSYFIGDDRLPVDSVSWYDCREFLNKLNERNDGYEYRLPSEAEWEYACRAGSTEDFAGDLDEMGWYEENSNDLTHPVGELKPNAWGFHDMHGNVWEWCQDEWHESYDGAPNDGSAWESGADISLRVARGGSSIYIAGDCRSAYRFGADSVLSPDIFGFRVVCLPSRTK